MDLGTPAPTTTRPRATLAPRLGAPAREAVSRLTDLASASRKLNAGHDRAAVLGSPAQQARLEYTALISIEVADRAGMTPDAVLDNLAGAHSPTGYMTELARAVVSHQGLDGDAHTVNAVADHLAAALSAPPTAEAPVRSYVDLSVPALQPLDNAIAIQQMRLGHEPWLAGMETARPADGSPVWQNEENPFTERFGSLPGYRALGAAIDQWGSYPGEQSAAINALAAGDSPSLSDATRTLAHVLRQGPHSCPDLFRGIALDGDASSALTQFAPGSEHVWPISSWTEDANQSVYFADRNAYSPEGPRTRVVMELEPGAQGLNTQAMAYRTTESEWLMGGGFTVTSAEVVGRDVHLKVRQTQPPSAIIPDVLG